MISYTSVFENFARVPAMIDRLFEGAPADDVPVEVNGHRVLVVNARTAREVAVRTLS
jgi:putative tryptophan/tyrosine transport system substrate-binding protein